VVVGDVTSPLRDWNPELVRRIESTFQIAAAAPHEE
jgi:hypothetical protein